MLGSTVIELAKTSHIAIPQTNKVELSNDLEVTILNFVANIEREYFSCHSNTRPEFLNLDISSSSPQAKMVKCFRPFWWSQ